MKYYKYADDCNELIEEAITYVEVQDGFVVRQLTQSSEGLIGSNVYYPKWGLMMAEGKIDYDSISEVQSISPGEFALLWQKHLANHHGFWSMTKQVFPLGTIVSGLFKLIYPQGVMIHLGENVIGVADYKACRASTGQRGVSSGLRIEATVNAYDENQQWLVLENPKIIDNSID